MLDFGVKDFIDVLLVTIVLFFGYKLMKKSRSVNIFYGVLLFISLWILVSKVLEMKLLGSILDQLVSVGAIAIIVLFQEEIRHLFYAIGTHERVNRLLQFFKPKSKVTMDDCKYDRDTIMPILMACLNMSKQKTGALIVLQNDLPLGDFVRTGERMDAKISQRLIENVFFKNSPLHDGAMIISGGLVTAASCILPISHDLDIPKEFGLRHRAARGISKETDALAIVVSEETGAITASYNNEYLAHIDAEQLERVLMRGKF
jgi:uncharacterized protein (TIGR00159 family)